jgi:hypothetical protein
MEEVDIDRERRGMNGEDTTKISKIQHVARSSCKLKVKIFDR